MSYESLIYAIDERGVATMKLNRPEKRNAINLGLMKEINSAIAEANQDPKVKIIVVTGEGSLFCAGADIVEFSDINWKVPFPFPAGGIDRRLKETDKITVAAVNGPAIGMGCDLALTCDFRIASEKATFWQAYARIMPPSGGTWYLPRMVGLQKAMEMLLLGEPVDAQEALKIGLVYRTVPHGDLMKEVEELIQKLLQFSPAVLQHTKHSIMKGLEQDFATAMEHVRYTRAVCGNLGIVKEAINAILEKRAPIFKY